MMSIEKTKIISQSTYMERIAVLASGRGSNLQALIDAIKDGRIRNGKIVLVISNNEKAYALERARREGIEAIFIDPRGCKDIDEYSEKLLKELKKREISLVCLAGFLLKLSKKFVDVYRWRILNIHPALLPKFGGAGMYGHHVHEAVIKAREKFSGPTVHFVDEEYDHGPIIKQIKVEVRSDDTPDSLADRVLKQEHILYPEVVNLFCTGKIKVVGGEVKIDDKKV